MDNKGERRDAGDEVSGLPPATFQINISIGKDGLAERKRFMVMKHI
jgi:hypothetical protein